MARVFIPYSLEGLAETVSAARFQEGQGDDEPGVWADSGHAVTDELRAALPELDDEGLEHYVLTEAAQESLETVASDDGRDRRLVLAVEVASAQPLPGELTRVTSVRALVPRDVVAYMVDTDDAVETVRAAAAAIRLGQDDAEELAQRCLDHELAWWATTEVDDVLALD